MSPPGSTPAGVPGAADLLGRARREWPRVRTALAKAAVDPEQRAKLRRAAQREWRARVRRPGVRGGLDLPPACIPDGPVTRPDLRVAVILDPFTSLALRYEWDQVAVTPASWREELSAQRPDLLFVESAWRGNSGAWRLAMTTEDGPSPALRELVAWCREQGVPTVFWNKEDPPNYHRFVATAGLFDQVFTVDADRLPDYRRDLGHDRVGLLPFGAQPRIHNPVRRGRARLYPVAFAGSYFADKHPERRAQLDDLLPAAAEHGLHIYSRMRAEDERYQFPARFRRHIVGTLPYEQMLAATTAYRVFLNVNSVTESPTMCARRLFELSAAQQPVLSGPSASIERYFADTVSVATDAEQAKARLGVLVNQPEVGDRLALRAHRRVFDDHLYRHRVDTVLTSVGLPVTPVDESVSVVVPTRRPEQLAHVLATLGAQVHRDLELVLVPHGFDLDPVRTAEQAAELGIEHVVVAPADAALSLGACMNLGVDAASGRYLAKVDDDNDYGPHYLSDLLRAFAYTDAEVVGKWAHYVHLASTDATVLRFAHAEHRFVDLVQGGTLLTPREVARQVRFEDLPRRVDTTFLEKVRARGGRVYSADRFNFVSRRSAAGAGHTWTISDDELVNRGGRVVFYGDPLGHVMV